MAKKLLVGEYDFSESLDSPVRKYRPLRPLVFNKSLDNDGKIEDEGARTDKQIGGVFNQKSCSTDNQYINTRNAELISNFQHGEEPLKASCTSSKKFLGSAPRSFALRSQRRVTYIWSEELIQRCNSMLKIPMRVHILMISLTTFE